MSASTLLEMNDGSVSEVLDLDLGVIMPPTRTFLRLVVPVHMLPEESQYRAWGVDDVQVWVAKNPPGHAVWKPQLTNIEAFRWGQSGYFKARPGAPREAHHIQEEDQ